MEHIETLNESLDRLNAAAGLLEQLAQRLTETGESSISRIVAQIDSPAESQRESELEQQLADAQRRIADQAQRIAELEAAAESTTPDVASRKTVPTAMANLLSKQGVQLDSIEASSLDAALTGLSLEQRFAVKAQLLRAGLLS